MWRLLYTPQLKVIGYSSVKPQQMMVIREFINRRDIFVVLSIVNNCIPINNCLTDNCIPHADPHASRLGLHGYTRLP